MQPLPLAPRRRAWRAVCALAVLSAACNDTSDPVEDDGCGDGGCWWFDAAVGASDSGVDGGLILLPDGGVIQGPPGANLDGSAPGDGSAADGGDGATSGASLPCDVQTVFDTYCSTCHASDQIAGFPLEGHARLQGPSPSEPLKPLYAAVVERLTTNVVTRMMPPAGSTNRPSAADIALIQSWANSGAPAGTACGVPDAGIPDDAGLDASTPDSGASDAGMDAGRTDSGVVDSGVVDSGTPDSGTPPGVTCYELRAHADGNNNLNTPYTVGVATDAYVNMTFAAPWQGTAYVQVFRPLPGNARVLHHWLLYKDGTPGTPGRVASSSGTHPDGELVFGWAPGGGEMDLRPRNVGLRVEGNTTYTLEFHYNSSDASATDRSGVQLCVTTTAPQNIAAQHWVGKDRLPFLNQPSATWSGTCRPRNTAPVQVVAVNPHMHQQGRYMRSVINRAAGGTTVLHDGAFDFNYQQSYTKDLAIQPGDTITTTCTYASPMLFGRGTNEEMCYLFTMAYPAGALTDGNQYGQTAHGDNTCLGNPN